MRTRRYRDEFWRSAYRNMNGILVGIITSMVEIQQTQFGNQLKIQI